MRVEIGRRARLQVERASKWWRANRRDAPLLLLQELDETLRRLIVSPSLGVVYPTRKRPALRRVLLPRTEYHLYFTLERDQTVIAIHSLWGARRAKGPR